MGLALDRIVIAVHVLQTAMDDYAALGFRVRRGVSTAGTESADIAFADGTHLQLLAWTGAAPHDPRWLRLQRTGEGMVGHALGATPATAAAASDTAHANGAVGVESLAVAVHDVDAELARLRALAPAGVPGVHFGRALAQPVAGTRMATVQLGDSALLLMAPRRTRGAPQEEHPLARRLAACGEGAYAVVLRTRRAEAWTVDLRLAHGAAIELVSAPGPATAAAAPASTAMVGG